MVRDEEWWKKEVLYQVYPRSFFDSSGDGVGDLKGLISKLDYIKETGFTAVWISPFFESPQRDFGYDISNYDEIDPVYGTQEEFEQLIDESHKRGLKIILDMVLNHTSDQHAWFKESRSSLDNPKRDWYIWHQPRKNRSKFHGKFSAKPHAPNNWVNHLNRRGWVYDDVSGEYYFASFFSFQPDLNWRNPEVKEAMFAVMQRYLKRGVDGFRLDIIGALFKEKNFRDNPLINQFSGRDYKGLFFRSFEMTRNREEVFEFAAELRSFVDRFEHKPFLLGEVFGDALTVNKFLGGKNSRGLHSVFYFKAAEVGFRGSSFRSLLQELEETFASPHQVSLAFSNHDRIRYLSKLKNSESRYKIALLFQLTVRALPVIYQGEEIGMRQARLPRRESLDHVAFLYRKLPLFLFHIVNHYFNGELNRDNARTPFLWDTTLSAGFSRNEVTWLPLYQKSLSLASQETDKNSLYHFARKLLHLRQERDSLSQGGLHLLPSPSPHVLAYEREFQGEKIRIILNFSRRKHSIGKLGEGELLFSTSESVPFIPERLEGYQGVLLQLVE